MNNGIAQITRIRFCCLAMTSATFFAVQLRADVVTDWNQTTVQALNAGGVGFAKQTRATAIVHAAMFDAMNAIAQRYQCYAFCAAADPGASVVAAGAAAAHGVMRTLVPSQQAFLDSAYATSLAAVSDATARASGESIGNAAADALLAQRAADGSAAVATYTPVLQPGVWRPTLPTFAVLAEEKPLFGNVFRREVGDFSRFPDFARAGCEVQGNYRRDS